MPKHKPLVELSHMLDVEVGLSTSTFEQQRKTLVAMQSLVDRVVGDLANVQATSEDSSIKLAASNLQTAVLSALQEQARAVEQRRGHTSGLQRALELLEPMTEKPEEDQGGVEESGELRIFRG
jgi:hypothetical protein